MLVLVLIAPVVAADTFVISDIRVEGLQRISAGTVFAALPVGGEASPMQRWYFNALPDVYIPLSLLKAIGGPPLTMQWPVPEW